MFLETSTTITSDQGKDLPGVDTLRDLRTNGGATLPRTQFGNALQGHFYDTMPGQHGDRPLHFPNRAHVPGIVAGVLEGSEVLHLAAPSLAQEGHAICAHPDLENEKCEQAFAWVGNMVQPRPQDLALLHGRSNKAISMVQNAKSTLAIWTTFAFPHRFGAPALPRILGLAVALFLPTALPP